MKLPASMTTVTTFSKILALICFVTLPLLGFYLGVNYGESLCPLKSTTTNCILYSSSLSENTSVQSSNNSSNPLTCGVTNCHGVDVTCGYSSVPIACDLVYEVGDRCRVNVQCKEVNGSCVSIKLPNYNTCVSCVQKCTTDFPNNPQAQSTCESMCN